MRTTVVGGAICLAALIGAGLTAVGSGGIAAAQTDPGSTTTSTTTSVPPTVDPVAKLTRFPTGGVCYYIDTWGAPRSGGRKHEGVDVIAKAGTPLYAVVDGTIWKTAFDRAGSLGGNQVWLRSANGSGTYYFYAHLQEFSSLGKVGATVKAGDVIGWVGETGNASTPHLHFEVHPNGGAAVNPTPYVTEVENGQCKKQSPLKPPSPTTTVPSSPTTTAPAGTTTTTTTVPPTTAPPPTTTPTGPAAGAGVVAGSGAARGSRGEPSGSGGPAETVGFEPLLPIRVVDTQLGVGGQRLRAGEVTGLALGAAVPGLATGVAGTVTATGLDGATTVQVGSCDVRADTAVLMFAATGATAGFMAPLEGERLCVSSSRDMDLTIDVTGYLTDSAARGLRSTKVGSALVYDSRLGTSGLSAELTRSVKAVGFPGLPGDSRAVTVTITVPQAAAPGTLRVFPCGGTPPATTTLNYDTSGTSRTTLTVGLSGTGTLCLRTSSWVHFTVAVNAYWRSGSGDPIRLANLARTLVP
jgi:hypothetical protein